MGVAKVLLLGVCLLILVACNSYDQQQTAVQVPAEVEVVEEPVEEEPAEEVVEVIEEPEYHLIRIESLGFDPRTIVVNAGDRILFNNSNFESGGVHIVVGWEIGNKANQFKSGRLAYGDSFEVVLDTPATYTYLDAGLEDDDERELFSGTIIVE